MCAGWGWIWLLSCIKLTENHEILSVASISLLYRRHGLYNIMYPKGRQSRKLLKKGYWFYTAINWWFLYHHCNFETPSRSALISVTNICQQQFFSSHLLKKNSVGREVFRLNFWSYLYMHITTYSYYLKQDEKQCLKANLVRSVTTSVVLGIHALATGWPVKLQLSSWVLSVSHVDVTPAQLTFRFSTNVWWLWVCAGPVTANVHTYADQTQSE